MAYWLMKSEPDECSIDDLRDSAAQTVPWTGVRNYQARNFLRDAMHPGDGVLFYHSSCPEPGIAGLAEVVSEHHPDETQFDPQSPYFDPVARRDSPRWFGVDIRFVRKTPLLSLAQLRVAPEFASLRMLQRGSRLSITPVTTAEWTAVLQRLGSA